MTAFHCPLCQTALVNDDQGIVCTNNHRFDLAKEGYVNLLPVQYKGSKVPGDSKEMVMARRAFLENGHYQFLQSALVKTIEARLTESEPATIVDCGCGEGYYTNAIAQQVTSADVYGIDIAKAAVRYAAKRSDLVKYAVASTSRIPIKDNNADIVSKVFAPVDAQEVARILKPEGTFISVVPGRNHLFELKQQIYDTPRYHQVEKPPAGFSLDKSKQLSQEVSLNHSADIAALLQMTPFSWKLTHKKKQQLIDSGCFEVTFDFVLNQYRMSA